MAPDKDISREMERTGQKTQWVLVGVDFLKRLFSGSPRCLVKGVECLCTRV